MVEGMGKSVFRFIPLTTIPLTALWPFSASICLRLRRAGFPVFLCGWPRCAFAPPHEVRPIFQRQSANASQTRLPAKLFSLLHFCILAPKTAFTESLQGFFRGQKPRF